MGFKEGKFWKWIDRESGIRRPHLLLEKPNCKVNVSSLFNCNWASRQFGSGVCGNISDCWSSFNLRYSSFFQYVKNNAVTCFCFCFAYDVYLI